jgi:hypothetical protein
MSLPLHCSWAFDQLEAQGGWMEGGGGLRIWNMFMLPGMVDQELLMASMFMFAFIKHMALFASPIQPPSLHLHEEVLQNA